MPPECDRIIADPEMIARRVDDLGDYICARHPDSTIRLITVLRGGLFFLADLSRVIDADVRLDFLAVAPYVPGGGGSVRVTKDLDDDIVDSRVVLVEDVVDTGLTLHYVLSLLRDRNPLSLDVVTLFDKPARRIAPVPISWTGFEVADDFLVGYGLDFGGRYRNLPYVASLDNRAVFG
jgi:hypoxanthine phosphoribosyltransferase